MHSLSFGQLSMLYSHPRPTILNKHIRFPSKVSYIISFSQISFFPQQNSFSQIKDVRALGDGQKIFRNDLNHLLKMEVFIWNRKMII